MSQYMNCCRCRVEIKSCARRSFSFLESDEMGNAKTYPCLVGWQTASSMFSLFYIRILFYFFFFFAVLYSWHTMHPAYRVTFVSFGVRKFYFLRHFVHKSTLSDDRKIIWPSVDVRFSFSIVFVFNALATKLYTSILRIDLMCECVCVSE